MPLPPGAAGTRLIRRRRVGIADGTANAKFLTQALAAVVRRNRFAKRKALRLAAARIAMLLLHVSNGIGNL